MSSVLAGLDGCHWIAAYDSRHSANGDAAVDARRNGASDGAAEVPGDTLPGDGCDENCEVELAITSHANETNVVHFEERFTGVCDSDRSLTATPGPRVTIIDSSCVGNVLELQVGFQSVDGGAEDRTFTLEDGVSTHEFTVRFKLECPDNYSGVAGDTEMGTTDFCVANYEMKKDVSGDIDPDGNTGPNRMGMHGGLERELAGSVVPRGLALDVHYATAGKNELRQQR